jgi:uncharacterized protein (TIGR03086 family)
MSRGPAGRPSPMTTEPIDLRPAAHRLAAIVRGVREDQLTAPTPCPEYTVGDLLDHIGGLAKAFTWAATKESLAMPDVTPTGDAAGLGVDWRRRIPADVEALGDAWTDPAAWTGMTKAGPIEMPGEIGGLVALDEIVIHGWDVALATGQPFHVDAEELAAVHTFAAMFSGPGTEEQRAGGFGPELTVADDAPLLERVLAMLGRDAGWRPPG